MGDNHFFIHVVTRFVQVAVIITCFGCNTFMISSNLDPCFLFFNYFPELGTLLTHMLGFRPNAYILILCRVLPITLGCVVVWAMFAVVILAFGSLTVFVHDMMLYLIGVVKGSGLVIKCHPSSTYSQEPIQIPLYLVKLIIKHYKHMQIYVRELNNVMHTYAGLWVLTIAIITVIWNYGTIYYISTISFMFTLFLPCIDLMLNLAPYILLGMVADLGAYPEILVRECKSRVRNKQNVRLLNSLYLFRVKVDQIRVRRDFIAVFFKFVTDNTVTLLLSF